MFKGKQSWVSASVNQPKNMHAPGMQFNLHTFDTYSELKMFNGLGCLALNMLYEHWICPFNMLNICTESAQSKWS